MFASKNFSWRCILASVTGVGLVRKRRRGRRSATSAARTRPCQLPAGRLRKGTPYSIESFPPDSVLAIYFGYTTCLRACPVALDNIAAAMDGLGAQSASIQPVFVDMDPERADPVNLKLYMETFGPRFLGLTGSAEAVAERGEVVQGPGRTPAVQRRSDRLRDDAPVADLRDATRRPAAIVPAGYERTRRHRGRAQESHAIKSPLETGRRDRR